MTIDQALAEMIEISTHTSRVALFDTDGSLLAESGVGTSDTTAVANLWAAADEAAHLLGRPPVTQCEIGLRDAFVFAVREQGRSAIAVTDRDATAGLVFYDLRAALRASGDDDASK